MMTNDLPDGMVEWIAEIGRGEITRLERHVARREAWVVDVTRPDGSVLEGFLRLERHDARDGIASPRWPSETPDHRGPRRHRRYRCPTCTAGTRSCAATLFERVPGRSDIDKLDDPAQQRAVMEDFMRVIARMHRSTSTSSASTTLMPYRPTTPAEAALSELDLTLVEWKDFLADYTRPADHLRGRLAAPLRPRGRCTGCRSSRATPGPSTSCSRATA